MKLKDRKLLIILKSGIDKPDDIGSAFLFACLAAKKGMLPTIFCIQDGIEAVVEGALSDSVIPGGVPLTVRLWDAVHCGVEIKVCVAAMLNRGIRKEHLIKEAEIAEAPDLIEHAWASDATLSF